MTLVRPVLLRLLRLGLLLLFVALVVFALMKASPLDPVDAYLGPAIAHAGPEQRAQIVAAWGLDRPVAEQFLRWLGRLAQGDLGRSTAYGAPVAQVIGERLGASLLLAGPAWVLSGLLGFGLGILAAAREGTWLDRGIRAWCYLLAATPTFWLAMLMLMLFSVRLGWTPVCCAGPIGTPPDQVTAAERARHLLLPLAALTLFGVAQIALHTRMKLIEVMRSDYVAFATAQGGGRAEIVLRHGLRNAALPALTVLFASVGEIIGGAILAEQVFAWPGLGRATVEAGMTGDVPLLLAIALLTTLIVATGNMVADLLCRVVDPRIGGRA